ncbi:MAG: SDR family oxidoreductase [Thermomicrobiales bacterium]
MPRIPGKLALLATGTVAAAILNRLRRERTGLSFDRKVVLITGGSRGLGLALAEEIAKSGARLAICARDAGELSEAEARLKRLGAEVLAKPCDVSDEDAMYRFVNDVEQHFGRIDILINNAGIIMVGPARTFTAEDLRRSMDTIYWGAVFPTLAVLPGMTGRGAGSIVNITSIGGYLSVPHLLPYSAAKFALAGFSEGLSAELSGTGVNVTTVVPDVMRTGSYRHARFKGQHQKEYGWFATGASLPWRRSPSRTL